MARLCFGCMLVFALIISPGCERRGDSSANSTPSAAGSSGIVGAWVDHDGETWDLNVDGTYVDYEDDEGSWRVEGNVVTLSYGADCECPEYDLDGTFLSDESMVLYDGEGAEWTLTR